eukprot:CAMPEP_0172589030 /NCGR_PEP_ID=MMETSP1068-20121228/7844_1 /TAXON_ID=35684 /ORGANISM="Pseudopedinella elastica, Strain CCMP716" /LENGTH=94 /DNA_ID=CAMNT_0013384535 /DNA_START=212 /DNA_END=497 /DNA_ORIENTATION=+
MPIWAKPAICHPPSEFTPAPHNLLLLKSESSRRSAINRGGPAIRDEGERGAVDAVSEACAGGLGAREGRAVGKPLAQPTSARGAPHLGADDRAE